MADKAKHAFGSRKNLSNAITNKIVDSFDVLFLSGEGESPAMGWVDRDGNPIILSPTDDLEKVEEQLEAQIATKANATEVESQLSKKADAEEVKAELATKVEAEEVDAKIKQAVQDIKHPPDSVKYKILDAPSGTLVDYFDKEIRIMCKSDAAFVKQAVGTGGNPNCFYVTLKTYAPDDAVGYIEHLGEQVDAEVLTDLKTDEYGRKYQLTWLAVAVYDEASGTWSYYGKSSSKNKYIGWDYQIDFYDVDGVMIESDCVRINLSNEQCHSTVEPYYVGEMMAEIGTKIEEKIEEINVGYEIIEF